MTTYPLLLHSLFLFHLSQYYHYHPCDAFVHIGSSAALTSSTTSSSASSSSSTHHSFRKTSSSGVVGHRRSRRRRINNSNMAQQVDDNDAASASVVADTFTKIDGISSPELLEKYDTFLLDMWGVMHDGSKPYEGVLQTVEELKKAGKKMIILSNSSKRRENSEKMLVKLGFDPSDFDNIITSGDISHSLLQNNADSLGCQNWPVLTDLIQRNKKNVFVFGSGVEDEHYVTSAGWTLTSIEHADLIVSRGTFTINDGTTITSKNDDEMNYWKVMEEAMVVAARRKVPMLVTNPDKKRPDEGLPPMPGAIGDTYERFVWTHHCHPVGDMTEESARDYVKRIGKPFGEVYDIALSGLGNDDDDDRRSRAIMVGDALETDVVGGSAAGVDALWVVKDGIHGADAEEGEGGAEGVLSSFNGMNYATYAYGKTIMPRYLTDHFRW